MCLVILAYKVYPDWPVILAANRDEYYDRPTQQPALWPQRFGRHQVVAGKDLRAGGTWLMINSAGLLAAVANRYPAHQQTKEPSAPSRGLLPLMAAPFDNAAQAAGKLSAHLHRQAYNPCNCLLVDRHSALALHYHHRRVETVELTGGWHFLAHEDIDESKEPKLVHARMLCNDLICRRADPEPPFDRLTCILAQHHKDDPALGPCVHGQAAGTVSSTLIAVGSAGMVKYLHAAGPPCRTPYRPVHIPWDQ